MTADTFLIRPEVIADHGAIRALTARAFAGRPYSDGSEPRVIDGLRAAGALALSLVAVLDTQIVGHVAFSPAGPLGWFALGPVSVEPALQRRGIGSRMIREGLRTLRDRGAVGCVLVGDHRYYERFGFVVRPELAPPGIPAEHFHLLSFGERQPDAPITFHPAFGV
jgi:putative acetyltransferase